MYLVSVDQIHSYLAVPGTEDCTFAMARQNACTSELIRWKSRPAVALSNGAVELIVLTGGGHIASFRFAGRGPNLLWEVPWTTMDPQNFRESHDYQKYGRGPVGKFLSGSTGHMLALGYFGMPSAHETEKELALNGEAASSAWRVTKHTGGKTAARVVMEVKLPVAGLQLERQIELRNGEPFARISETVSNQRESQNFFQWVECATFGEPLLSPKVSVMSIPGFRAQTAPTGYDGHELLATGQQFRWPIAPSIRGGSCDLRQSFHQDGKGFVASVLLDTTRADGFVSVFNPELRIAAGYCYSREIFPWVSIWEENHARTNNPWNGMTRARGVQFGTSPLPLGLAQAVFNGPMFDTPTLTSLDGQKTITAEYRLFAAEVSPAWEAIGEARSEGDRIVLRGTHRSEVIRI